ncbi:MAG TPA: recombination mediator RecR [Bacteroidales bacterium]|nr:recombination mediator RecR [Bacteroidales bacterium]
MAEYSSILLENAVNELARLPGIGRKTALRLALHLLRESPARTELLVRAVSEMRSQIKHCSRCNNLSDAEWCSICSNHKRDENVVCVVEDVRDVMAIERTSSFNGLYHVLGGVISPVEGIGPAELSIGQFIQRLNNEPIKEIILALPSTIEGDTTAFYIFRQIQSQTIRVTTIARGISIGDALEYADEVTLGRSIINRVPYQKT